MEQNFGKRLTKLREVAGLTRYRLSKNSGISYSYIVALEESKHSPSLDVIEKVASGLGLTIAQFFEEENREEVNSQ